MSALAPTPLPPGAGPGSGTETPPGPGPDFDPEPAPGAGKEAGREAEPAPKSSRGRPDWLRVHHAAIIMDGNGRWAQQQERKEQHLHAPNLPMQAHRV